MPFGAPGDGPPCILQRPFGIAGDWHGLPLRVLAPHLGAWCISKSIRLILWLSESPTPLGPDVADNGLSALVDMHVFDGNLLLTFSTMPVEGFQ